jgi:exosortase/archaeosortase family protein
VIALKKTISFIPIAIRAFVIKATLIFVIWNLVYILFLRSVGFPDDLLTHAVTKYTVKLLNCFIDSSYSFRFQDHYSIIFKSSKPIVAVHHACNALELYVLYIGFLICVPTTLKRMLLFTVLGFFIISLSNVARIAGLSVLHSVSATWQTFNHKYLFKGIVYFIIFLLWRSYAKGLKIQPD